MPALITPMTAGGEVDLPAWESLLRFHAEQGSDAVVVGGTTGESPALTGNELMVWGANLPAQITRFDAAVGTGTSLAEADLQLVPRLAIDTGQPLRISWTAQNEEPGLALELFAVNERGTRYPIASQYTTTDRQLAGDTG